MRKIYYKYPITKTATLTMVETAPSVRNIRFYHDLQKKTINYFLSFPYVQTAVLIEGKKKTGTIYVGLTKKPFHPETNPDCFVPPLPNCYANFSVCGVLANHDNTDQVFWNSNFHGDFYAGNEYLNKSSMKNLNVWQKMTKIAPEFIMSEGVVFGSKAKPFVHTILNEGEDYEDDDDDYEDDYDDDDDY